MTDNRKTIEQRNRAMAKYFGPKETEVISRLSYEKVTLITKEQFDKLLGIFLTRQIIYQLKKKGVF